MEKRHAVTLARRAKARGPHRRSALCPHCHRQDRCARRDLYTMATRPRRQIERRRLLPLDRTAFPVPAAGDVPLLDLAPEALLSELTAGYMHAQLCRAALHAFAAENEARVEAMASARHQIERQLSSLK